MERTKTKPPQKPGNEAFHVEEAERPRRPWFRAVGVILLAGAAYGIYLLAAGGGEAPVETGATYRVTRGDLRISVIEGGSLRAQRSVEIKSKVEGRATLVYLIPEGTYVKEGDLLVQLDSSDLEEAATQQEIQYESAKAAKIQAEQELAIQKSQNESDITKAQLSLLFAEQELQKYEEGGWPLQKSQLENTITIADEEMKRAKNRVKWTEELHKKGFVTKDELEADQLALKKSEIQLQQAKEQLALAVKYDYPMQLKKLQSDVEEAKQELARTQSRAESQLAQKEANLKSREAQFKLQEERFNKLKEQLANCTIKAPSEGLVVYGSQKGGDRWRRSESEIVEEGTEVRFRQTLITLPDVSVMVVDTRVHESEVDKVEVGQPARVTVDAFPDHAFNGKVTKVAILPDSTSRWLNPDLKVYSTEITLEGRNDKLKPGMSAMVEIVVEELNDVVYVPIQSVFRRNGQEVCYVLDGGGIQARPVTVGLNNDQFVEIRDGLSEGEEILLYEPALGQEVGGEEGGAEETGAGQGAGSGEVPAKPAPGTGPVLGRGGRDREAGGGRGTKSGRPALSPEMAEAFRKFRSMSPEERKAALEKMRAEGKLPEGFDPTSMMRGRGPGGAGERKRTPPGGREGSWPPARSGGDGKAPSRRGGQGGRRPPEKGGSAGGMPCP